MHAVIYQEQEHHSVGMLPIAGKPLVARQIQWLRTTGAGPVAVQVETGPGGEALAYFLREQDPIGMTVTIVRSERPLGARAIARLAGFPENVPLLGLPTDLLCGGDLPTVPEDGSDRALHAAPPLDLQDLLEGGRLSILSQAGRRSAKAVPFSGWAVRVRSFADAVLLGVAVLDGRLSRCPDRPSWGIEIHAAERSPGVWVSRGALVEPGAELRAPVLVGPDAVVRAGASAGPRAFIGERAVIEAGAIVADALVMGKTIVGEGLHLIGLIAEPSAIIDPVSGARVPVNDSLVLGCREDTSSLRFLPRTLGLVLLAIAWHSAVVVGSVVASVLMISLQPGRSGMLPRFLAAVLAVRVLLGPLDWPAPVPSDDPKALQGGEEIGLHDGEEIG